MKRIILVLCVLIATNVLAQKHDIREVNWGWTLAQVKAVEKAKLYGQTKNELTYIGLLNNKSYTISYTFIDNKLVELTYTCNEDYVNKNNYVDDYKELKSILSGRYGEKYYDREN